MSPEEIRLQCLRAAIPSGISNPDTKMVLERAEAYAAFVTGRDTRTTAPVKPAPTLASKKTGYVAKTPA